MTMDGKIATVTGASKWITGEESRNKVQYLRHKYMGIMAGIGTVLADDPMMNVRVDGLKSPVRVIADSHLRIPLDSNIVKTAGEYRTIVVHCMPDTDGVGDHEQVSQAGKAADLKKAGIELVRTPSVNGHVDVAYLMKYLGEAGIDSVLVEGGGTLNDSIIRAGLVDRVEVFIAPKIFGGQDAKSPVAGIGINEVDQASKFKLFEVAHYGDDIQLSYIEAEE